MIRRNNCIIVILLAACFCLPSAVFGVNRPFTGGMRSDGIEWYVYDGYYLGGGRNYTVNKERESITAYSDFTGEFTIPSYVYGYEGKEPDGKEIWRGYTITAVGWNAVGNKPFEYLTSVVVSEGIDTINGAFNGASGLVSVSLPSTLRKITNCAFCGCSSLKTIVIPDGVTEIGDSAFSGCTGIETLVLPSSLQLIGNNAFEGCSSLRGIVIPPSCKSIGSGAFLGCTALASLSLGNCEELGDRVFKDCTSLQTLVVPSSVTNISKSAFHNCAGLNSVLFTTTLKKINDYAFQGCFSLKELILPEGLEYVGSRAFDGCTGIERLYIASTISGSGSYSFQGVSPRDLSEAAFWSLTETRVTNLVFLSGNTSFKCSSKMKDTLQRVELADTVTALSASAFSGFTNLEEIVCRGVITKIGDSAFKGCTKFTEFPLLNSSVTNWGDSVYSGCVNVERLVVPGSMKLIPASMFKDCTGLKNLVIEEGVETVSGTAFTGDINLESIYVGSSVTNLKFSGYTGPDVSKVVSATFCEPHPPKYVAKAFLQKFAGVVYYPPIYADEWSTVLDDAGIGSHKAWTAIAESDPGSVTVEGVDVEYSWLSEYGLLSDASPDAAAKAKAGKKDHAGNDMFVWQDFVAGTDPMDEDSKFVASIEMIEGRPVVSYSPVLSEAEKAKRIYTLLGKRKLQDAEWSVVAPDDDADYNFFRVTVEMK